MKILFISNINPNFTNTNFYREKALKELGCDVIFFNDRDFVLPGRIREKISPFQRWDIKRINRNMMNTAFKENPDMCLMVGGHRSLAETIVNIKKRGIKTILWTTDPPVDFSHIMETAPLYDMVFSAGTEAVELFKAKGLNNAIWLPFACDPDFHKPLDLGENEKKRYAHDIVFVGSYYPNRSAILENLSDMDISIWGPNWKRLKDSSPLKVKTLEATPDYSEWIKIYNASKIVIVIHYQDGRTLCNQASPKLFEALSCGSFVLSDNQKDARSLFQNNEHLVFFESGKDLKEKANYYLAHPEERHRIACKGHEEVVKKHTYKHRMREIIDRARLT